MTYVTIFENKNKIKDLLQGTLFNICGYLILRNKVKKGGLN